MEYLDTVLMVGFGVYFVWLATAKKEQVGSKSKIILMGGLALILLGIIFLFR